MIIVAIAFGTVSIAHLCSSYLANFFDSVVSNIESATTRNIFTFLGSKFFWMISIATIIAILLSFTKAKNYEGAGASKFGSVFIYILVASIGMKMDLTLIFDNAGLIVIGTVWMTIHAILLIGVAKLIRAPYFFLAIGSQANVGGAASAPIVASAFHPSLATVGVLLAVFGYAGGVEYYIDNRSGVYGDYLSFDCGWGVAKISEGKSGCLGFCVILFCLWFCSEPSGDECA